LKLTLKFIQGFDSAIKLFAVITKDGALITENFSHGKYGVNAPVKTSQIFLNREHLELLLESIKKSEGGNENASS